jgi:hypothetical protein
MEKIGVGVFKLVSEPTIKDEATRELVEAAANSPELDEWLDIQIQRGDHFLQERNHFRWDGISPFDQGRLRRVLALRMLEAKKGS